MKTTSNFLLLISLFLSFSCAYAQEKKTNEDVKLIVTQQIDSQMINSENEKVGTMGEAYELSEAIVKSRLYGEDEDNKKIIEDISANDLVVIDGTYDHIHLVLSFLKIPFTRISQSQVMDAKLQPHQTVFVNCAGSFPENAARKLATFVREGGQLITTDWALKSVLEPAFPGYVAYNEKPTGDEVVRIEVVDREDPVIKGFLDEKTEPVWWLEGSSYPIKILNKDKVKTLIRSKELDKKYGEEPVLIRFEYGKGVVYHMISHFYLQRTETKDAIQESVATGYLKDMTPAAAEFDAKIMEKAEDLNYGEVQSANTSSEMIMRAVVNQKKKNRESLKE